MEAAMHEAEPVRLLLVGRQGSEVAAAAAMARDEGAEVVIANDADAAIAQLEATGAHVVLVELGCGVPAFIERMRRARIGTPVLACGIDADAADAVAAIKAGASDYVPLPPERELIAAALALFAERAATLDVKKLVGHTVEEVERELILNTLERCNGNRTSASSILGISVRTMRNKLRAFIEAGIPVAPAP